MGWRLSGLTSLVMALTGYARAASADNEGACVKPGLPFMDDPAPQVLRHARAQLDAYLACMAPELTRLRAEVHAGSDAARRRDAALAEVDRISERWRSYEDRARIRQQR